MKIGDRSSSVRRVCLSFFCVKRSSCVCAEWFFFFRRSADRLFRRVMQVCFTRYRE